MTTSRDEMLALDSQLCFALVTAARNVVSIYRPILEPLGLTHPQYLVMLALWESSPRTLNDLADELAMDPATASPLVKRLEVMGLVARQRSMSDERRLDIVVTPEGQMLRERALEVPPAVIEATGMSLENIALLRESLRPFAGKKLAPVNEKS